MQPDPSVTVLVTRTIHEGREADFETWVQGVSAAAHAFPGHRGAQLVRPVDASRVYTLVFRFDTAAHLAAWEASAERRDWVERAAHLCAEPHVQHLTGLEGWFDPPPTALGPPPRWKMVEAAGVEPASETRRCWPLRV